MKTDGNNFIYINLFETVSLVGCNAESSLGFNEYFLAFLYLINHLCRVYIVCFVTGSQGSKFAPW